MASSVRTASTATASCLKPQGPSPSHRKRPHRLNQGPPTLHPPCCNTPRPSPRPRRGLAHVHCAAAVIAAVIAAGSRVAARPAHGTKSVGPPPARIPAGAASALGSYLGCWRMKRSSGLAVAELVTLRALGSQTVAPKPALKLLTSGDRMVPFAPCCNGLPLAFFRTL